MRSRPDLKLYLSPSRPAPGETLKVDVHLESKSETPFEAIDLELIGKESRYSHSTSDGKTSTSHYHQRDSLRLGHRFPGGTLTPGKHTRSVLFAIPESAPPTYKSSYSSIEYELSVRVHIPWWPDRHERYIVHVLTPEHPAHSPAPRVYSTRTNAPPKDEPGIELSLSSDQLQIGGQILGALAFSGIGTKKFRRIELTIATIEASLVSSATGPTVVDKRSLVISEETPKDGAPVPFRLKIPEDLAPAFRASFIQVTHELHADAIVAFGRDLGLRVPLTILRPAAPPPLPRDLPLVGKARHTAVFRDALEALKQAGYAILQEDAEEASVAFQVGDTLIRITEEHREGLGPCLVADVDGPPLGLGLRICERSWTDLGARLSLIDKTFQKRFTVHCREEAQGAALLTPPLCHALSAFQEAAVDDDSAVVLAPRSSRDRPELLRFFAAANHLAQTLNQAQAALPPPSSLSALVPAYQQFTRKHGGKLCIGDLSIYGWSVGGVKLTLDHEFQGQTPVRSRLWASVAPREQDAWSEAITRATEQKALFEEKRTGITLSSSVALPVCADPVSIIPLAESFAEVIASLSGGGSSSPYR